MEIMLRAKKEAAPMMHVLNDSFENSLLTDRKDTENVVAFSASFLTSTAFVDTTAFM